MNSIQALKVDRRLLDTSITLHVSSIYENTINCTGSDNRNYTLLNKRICGPLGISFNQAQFDLILLRINDTGYLNNGSLVFDNITIDLSCAEAMSLRLSQDELELPDFSDKLVNFLSFHSNDISLLGYFNQQECPNIWQSTAIQKIHDANTIKDLYSSIGLGIGLTPSIDDCLVGMLAIYHKLGIAIPKLGYINTTSVSQQMLDEAYDGYFNEALVNSIDEPSYQNFDEVAKIGSTSGIDTLIGVYKSIELIYKRRI